MSSVMKWGSVRNRNFPNSYCSLCIWELSAASCGELCAIYDNAGVLWGLVVFFPALLFVFAAILLRDLWEEVCFLRGRFHSTDFLFAKLHVFRALASVGEWTQRSEVKCEAIWSKKNTCSDATLHNLMSAFASLCEQRVFLWLCVTVSPVCLMNSLAVNEGARTNNPPSCCWCHSKGWTYNHMHSFWTCARSAHVSCFVSSHLSVVVDSASTMSSPQTQAALHCHHQLQHSRHTTNKMRNMC